VKTWNESIEARCLAQRKSGHTGVGDKRGSEELSDPFNKKARQGNDVYSGSFTVGRQRPGVKSLYYFTQ
jgi:hypothetical protein